MEKVLFIFIPVPMSSATAYPSFDAEAFLSQVDQANSQQEIFRLLKQLEHFCAGLRADDCKSFSEQVAVRLSHRFAQVIL
jgi:hypothetical protein